MATLYCIHCGEAFESNDPESVFCPEHGGEIKESTSTGRPSPSASPVEPLAKTAKKPDGPFAPPGGTQIREKELTVEEMARQGGWSDKNLKTYSRGDVLFGLYRIDDIKSGAMGHVYIAEHLQRGMKLAIKSPQKGMLLNDAFFSMVLKEADAWTDLGLHPNIAYCYYVRQLDGIPHIFIEYVDGGNLQEWIGEARCYDLKVGLDLAIQFCHGMGYAHSKGKIHRDIKPENILMTANGTLKVTDFGLIKSDVPSVGGCHVGRGGTNLAQMGTLAYMSPEQCEDPKNVDERTDIYAFGVCMYEMFCGRRPYEQTSELAASYLAKLDKKAAPEPTVLRPDLPESLAEILKKSIALERDERYSSLADLRKELTAVYREIFQEEAPHAVIDLPDLRADALNNRAVSYLDLGREEDAIVCWEEALKIDAVHFESTYNYHYLMFEKGRLPWCDFKAKLEGLEKDVGHRPEYWKALARQYLYMGVLEEVEKIQKSPHKQGDSEFLAAWEREKKRLIRTFTGHQQGVNAVAVTPDGQFALSGSVDKTLKLWDLSTGQEIRTFTGHTESVTSMAITPDGRYAISGSRDKALRLWDLSTGREIRTFTGHTESVTSIAITPDGRLALSGSGDTTLKLWDLLTGREERTFVGHKNWVSTVAITPDGRYAISGSADTSLKFWELSTAQEIWTFTGHALSPAFVAITPDGRYAISGNSGTIKLWNLPTREEINPFKGDTNATESVAITPNGRYAILGGRYGLKLLDLPTGQEIRSFIWNTYDVTSIAITPDSRFALFGSSKNILWLWNISKANIKIKESYPLSAEIEETSSMTQQSKKARSMLEKAKTEIIAGRFHKAIENLRVAQSIPGFERDPEILNKLTICRKTKKNIVTGLINGWCKLTYTGHNDDVCCAAFTPDSRHVLSGSRDGSLKLWELLTGQENRHFKGHAYAVSSVAITPNGRFGLSGSLDQTIKLWDLSTGQEIKTYAGHTGFVRSLAITPDGRFAISGSENIPLTEIRDKTLRCWDLSTGQEIKIFTRHTDPVNTVAITPDGRYTILKCRYGLKLLELPTGQEIRTFDGHTGLVQSVAITPDGRYTLSGSQDKTLKLWELSTGQEIRTFKGHSQTVTSVAITPDGRYTLSGSQDKTLKLWELSTGQEIRTFKGHSQTVTSVAITPDGRFAVSGSNDRTLKLWEFDWDFEIIGGD